LINTDVLVLTAELGVAIAGFSGVVVALDSRNVGEWSPLRRRYLRMLLQLSAIAVMAALIPLVVYDVAQGPNFWRWAVAIFGVVHAADVSTFIPNRPKGAPVAPLIAGLTAALLQLVAGLFGSESVAQAAYLGALVWYLGGAGTGFRLLVWGRVENPAV
jgi:hypothetical protein